MIVQQFPYDVWQLVVKQLELTDDSYFYLIKDYIELNLRQRPGDMVSIAFTPMQSYLLNGYIIGLNAGVKQGLKTLDKLKEA